jgi:nitronate monooxygenase
MPLTTRLTRLLGIDHPILLAPMDLVSGGRLAAAVSHAGGLGLLGGGYGDTEWLDQEWQQAGNARIGCGFITWKLAERPAALDAALARRPTAIMLSFGDPAPFAPAIKAAGAKLICQVQTQAHAADAADAGADVLVAQGTEAGGHGQHIPLLTLLPLVADAHPHIPVVAAGGIADGRGLAAMLTLGADGVLLGTRFYATEEALAPPEAKRRILAAQAGDSVRSTVFDIARQVQWPPGYTGRVLRNRLTERWLGSEAAMRAAGDQVARDYAAARAAGDFDQAAVIAGEAAALITDLPPAGSLVTRIVAEAGVALARHASFTGSA